MKYRFKQVHPKQVSLIAFTMEIIAIVSHLFRVALSGECIFEISVSN